MDQTPHPSVRPSYIPRPSRLPVPRSTSSTLPSSPSKEAASEKRSVSSAARLRAIPSRERLTSAPAPRTARSQLREPSPRSGYRLPRSSPNGRRDAISPGRLGYANWKSQEQDLGLSSGQNGSTAASHEPGTYIGRELRSRKSRPSLSERAMETLAQLPPSPAVRKKESTFFNPESPMRPSSRSASSRQGYNFHGDASMRPPSRSTGSRPNSSHLSDTSMRPPSCGIGSRPGSSMSAKDEAIPIDFKSSTSTLRLIKMSNAPANWPASGPAARTPTRARSNVDLRSNIPMSQLPSNQIASPIVEQSPSIIRPSSRNFSINPGSKTVSEKSIRPRASVGALFRKPSLQEIRQAIVTEGMATSLKKTSPTITSTSSEAISTIPKVSKESVIYSEIEHQKSASKVSSLALRDHIAKAKAARRAQMAKSMSSATKAGMDDEIAIIPTATFDFGLGEDPFNHQSSNGAKNGLLHKRISSARTDGRLNIAGMALTEIPPEVMEMYNLDSISGHGGSWAEVVDLNRFIAADNELTSIGDAIFPDIDPRAFEDDDDARGNQFAGLETLDLHGNLLQALPLGLRRLQTLTTLNLSNNKLGNDCFDIISQITNLKDLRLANNQLSGELDVRVTGLSHLEALDVQQNHLTSLSGGFGKLVRLRVLNLSRNEITSLSLDSFHGLPLTQLLAANNKLSGQLCPVQDLELPRLQILDVTGNSLTMLTPGQMRLPSLHQLSCSANRLTCLPDISSWLSLLTLSANDNSISTLPEGFTSLLQLKNVDLSGNDISELDDAIGRMESLDTFSINGNPLKEKRFVSMITEDLKRTLRARLVQESESTKDDTDTEGSFATATSSPTESARTEWTVKAGGILDRSSTQSHSLNPVLAAQLATTNAVRVLELHHNTFKEIPNSIAFFAATLTTVNLTHNLLTSDTFLVDEFDLPTLKELNLSSNTFNSVRPLMKRLRAPQLSKLDISFNRLTSLPALRLHFPKLTTLLASNNSIKELAPESIEGLKVVDCSSNDLNSLNAKIGLLGGPMGLERLDVRGNRFRVPSYTVLDKGTEALLAWLRNRIPVGELDSGS